MRGDRNGAALQSLVVGSGSLTAPPLIIVGVDVRDHFTKRNHYNPCSWTALWNRSYFDAVRAGAVKSLSPRKQTVFVLNLMADTVFETTVENVHYDKGLGVAEITPDAMKDFCRRRYPKEYESLAEYVDKNPETLSLDFEDILEWIENKCGYDSLLEVARVGNLSSAEHRGFLICVLIIHAMRSHEMMASMIAFADAAGIPKWEYFWMLKNAWGNPVTLARPATQLAIGRWILYRTAEHRFPLCDSPVMIGRDTLIATLSPNLILEVDFNKTSPPDSWELREGISRSKYKE